jgi:hypothetical protein
MPTQMTTERNAPGLSLRAASSQAALGATHMFYQSCIFGSIKRQHNIRGGNP